MNRVHVISLLASQRTAIVFCRFITEPRFCIAARVHRMTRVKILSTRRNSTVSKRFPNFFFYASPDAFDVCTFFLVYIASFKTSRRSSSVIQLACGCRVVRTSLCSRSNTAIYYNTDNNNKINILLYKHLLYHRTVV